jgi:hypothetical protein
MYFAWPTNRIDNIRSCTGQRVKERTVVINVKKSLSLFFIGKNVSDVSFTCLGSLGGLLEVALDKEPR